jgi:hypothetical protein
MVSRLHHRTLIWAAVRRMLPINRATSSLPLASLFLCNVMAS